MVKYVGERCLRGGHAQAGHPAAIVQSATGLPIALIIPLTSQLDALRFTGTVLVEADAQNGLRRARRIALVFQLTARQLLPTSCCVARQSSGKRLTCIINPAAGILKAVTG